MHTSVVLADLILIRHAQPCPLVDGRYEDDPPLSNEGVTQAESLITNLVSVAPTIIVSSPRLRAIQTVEPFARAVDMSIRPERDLREWDSGVSSNFDKVRHFARCWDQPRFAHPGAESLDDFTYRVTAVLTSLMEQNVGGTVVAATHGRVICRALFGLGVSTVDVGLIAAMPMPAIYRVRFVDGKIHAAGPGL